MSEQRAPLLSDEDINAIEQPLAGTEHERISARWGMRTARDFYEDKITKGELMVVRTVKHSDFVEASARNLKHENCPGPGDGWVPKRAMECEAISFCPGCGAKIANQ